MTGNIDETTEQTSLSQDSFGSSDTPPGPSIAFEDISTHNDLVKYSREYAEQVVIEEDMDVDMSLISDWEISTRSRRRAAAVKHVKIPNAKPTIPIDWETAREKYGSRAFGSKLDISSIDECVMSLTWEAAMEFGEDEWKSTIRHELIHVEEFQYGGKSTHGTKFKARAQELDAGVHCQKFSDAEYVIVCRECGEHIADRYRDCKVVKHARKGLTTRYTSGCCSAAFGLQRDMDSFSDSSTTQPDASSTDTDTSDRPDVSNVSASDVPVQDTYILGCSGCGQSIATRQKRSKTVQDAYANNGEYVSPCCEEELTLNWTDE